MMEFVVCRKQNIFTSFLITKIFLLLLLLLDCCDGSDEYSSSTECNNTCFEKGKEEREKVKEIIDKHERGYSKKLKMIEEAKNIRPNLMRDWEESKMKLEEFEQQLAGLEEIERAAQEIKDIAEEIHDDDSEDYIREDEEVDDEEKNMRRKDIDRISAREEFEANYGITTAEAKEGSYILYKKNNFKIDYKCSLFNSKILQKFNYFMFAFEKSLIF